MLCVVQCQYLLQIDWWSARSATVFTIRLKRLFSIITTLWSGVAVARWSRSTKLTYIGPG